MCFILKYTYARPTVHAIPGSVVLPTFLSRWLSPSFQNNSRCCLLHEAFPSPLPSPSSFYGTPCGPPRSMYHTEILLTWPSLTLDYKELKRKSLGFLLLCFQNTAQYSTHGMRAAKRTELFRVSKRMTRGFNTNCPDNKLLLGQSRHLGPQKD